MSTVKANSAVICLQLVCRAGSGLLRDRAKGRAVGFSPPSGFLWLTFSPLSLCALSVPGVPLPISVFPSGHGQHEIKYSGGRPGDGGGIALNEAS